MVSLPVPVCAVPMSVGNASTWEMRYLYFCETGCLGLGWNVVLQRRPDYGCRRVPSLHQKLAISGRLPLRWRVTVRVRVRVRPVGELVALADAPPRQFRSSRSRMSVGSADRDTRGGD